LGGFVLLAILTYLPFMSLPPLQDDYLQRDLAERYGPPAGWGALAHDPLYRCRATSILWTSATMWIFGTSTQVMNASTLLLHGINVVLVGLLGSCRWIGWRLSLVAAFIFAVRERHHEAVVWYASLHEPLVLMFVLVAVICLIQRLEGGGVQWWAGVAAGWLLALLSKESGVVLAALLPAIAFLYGRRKTAIVLLAVGAFTTGAYFLMAHSQRNEHQHFNDGTFSFGIHFLPTLVTSTARGLWIWGGLALIAFTFLWRKVDPKIPALAAVWLVGGLLPYAFLTYMPRIPSRHHYVASVGGAILIALAFWLFLDSQRRPRLIAAALACAFIAHNWGYLWVSKKPQFEWRAAVIEGFVDFVSRNPNSRVVNGCSELNNGEAWKAVHYRLGVNPEDVILASADPSTPVYHCPPPPGH
jgi:hypothetical protein